MIQKDIFFPRLFTSNLLKRFQIHFVGVQMSKSKTNYNNKISYNLTCFDLTIVFIEI